MGNVLFDGIEKLITEHGSAAILKERIALASDKYSALETQKKELELKVENLQSLNATLEANYKKSQEQVRNLEEKLAEPHGARLPIEEKNILHILATAEEVFDSEIAKRMSASDQKTAYWLQELDDKKLACPIIVMSFMAGYGKAPTSWRLQQDGRRYLMKHGLMP